MLLMIGGTELGAAWRWRPSRVELAVLAHGRPLSRVVAEQDPRVRPLGNPLQTADRSERLDVRQREAGHGQLVPVVRGVARVARDEVRAGLRQGDEERQVAL